MPRKADDKTEAAPEAKSAPRAKKRPSDTQVAPVQRHADNPEKPDPSTIASIELT